MKTLRLYLNFVVVFFAALTAAHGATVNWTNTAGGNWSQTNNWSPNQVPGANDTAIITNAGTYNVLLDQPASLAGLVLGASSGSGVQTFLMNGQSLTLNGQATVNAQGFFNFNGGTLSGTNVWQGDLNWSSGNLGGASALTIATNGVLNITGGTVYIYSGITNSGTINWTAGDMEVINSYGNSSLGGINNLAGAVFNAKCDQTIVCACYGYEYFVNAGTFRKSSSSGTTSINVAFSNSGSLDVKTGMVSVNGGGSGSGVFVAESGATLAFPNNFNAQSGAVFSGAGTNVFSGGTVTINGSITTSNSVFSGGGLAGGGFLGGTFNWLAGEVAGGSTLTVSSNGVMNITSGATHYLTGSLTNAGVINWTAGNVQVANDGSSRNGGLNNLAGATFNAQSDQTIVCACYGLEYFSNAGAFVKSASVGTTTVNVIFTNSGIVDVKSGVVNVSGGGFGAGRFVAEMGGTLEFANNYTTGAAALFSGTGTNLFAGGTVVINGSITTSNSVFSGGDLAGGGFLGGSFNWSAGEIAPGSTLTISTNGIMNITTGSTHYLTGALTNAGVINWTGGNVQVANDGSSRNGGLNNLAGAIFNAQCDQTIVCACYGQEYFSNAGLLQKTASFGSTSINVSFTNKGIVDIQSGSMALNAGGSGNGQFIAESQTALSIAAGYTGGMFSGAGSNLLSGGTFSGTFSNSGTLIFSGGNFYGNLNISGTMGWTGGIFANNASLTIQSNATFNIQSGGGNGFYGFVLTNYGTVNWSNTTIYGRNAQNAQIYNYGTWNAQSDNGFIGGNQGGSTLFNNYGTFLKSGNTGITTLDGNVIFNNTGSIVAQSGTLDIRGGGINSNGGNLSTTNTGNLSLENFTFSGNSNTLVSGTNAVYLGGNTTINGLITASNLQLVAGTFGGTNVLKGTLTWSGGIDGRGNDTRQQFGIKYHSRGRQWFLRFYFDQLRHG